MIGGTAGLSGLLACNMIVLAGIFVALVQILRRLGRLEENSRTKEIIPRRWQKVVKSATAHYIRQCGKNTELNRRLVAKLRNRGIPPFGDPGAKPGTRDPGPSDFDWRRD